MSAGWWRQAPRVRSEVCCGDHVHHVTWRRGSLVLEDHDVPAELVVDRLGGPAPECMRVLREWRDRARWSARLQPPGPGFRTTVPATALPEALAARRSAGALHALERSWRRRGDVGDEERRIHWFVASAALPSLRESTARMRELAGWGSVPLGAVEVRPARPRPAGQPGPVLGRMWAEGVRLRVALSPRWLVAVRDAGRVLDGHGRFVADVDDCGPVVVEWTRQGRDLVPVLRHAADLDV